MVSATAENIGIQILVRQICTPHTLRCKGAVPVLFAALWPMRSARQHGAAVGLVWGLRRLNCVSRLSRSPALGDMLVARIKFKLPCRHTLQSPCEELLNGTLVTGIGARYNKTGPQALCFLGLRRHAQSQAQLGRKSCLRP